MKFKRIEYHTVHSHFEYDLPDEDIIETFGSVERFREICIHLNNTTDWDSEPRGEYPTDEESDTFFEFTENYNYDRYDDWFSDRKGGYEISYEIVDSQDLDEADYDSDEELLN
jgi:hypothetical protein